MSEDVTAGHQEVTKALPSINSIDRSLSPEEHWNKLKERGVVKGDRPDRAKRVRTSEMRPITYHGTNEDLLRDLGRNP